MTDHDKLRALYDQYMRQTDSDPKTLIETTDYLTRMIWHPIKHGMVSYSQLTSTSADTAIDDEMAYFRALGYDFEWKLFSYDAPDDLGQRLQAKGLSRDEREAVMVLPIATAPPILLAEPTIEIQQATTLQHFRDIDAIFYEVWKDDPYTQTTTTGISDWLWPRVQTSPDNIEVYVIYVDGRAVTYGRVEFAAGNPFASIWGGSTLAGYRRRGYYTQLVAKRLQVAQARGAAYLTVDARPDTSKPILQKLGFQHLADATAYNWAHTGA